MTSRENIFAHIPVEDNLRARLQIAEGKYFLLFILSFVSEIFFSARYAVAERELKACSNTDVKIIPHLKKYTNMQAAMGLMGDAKYSFFLVSLSFITRFVTELYLF